MATIVPDMKNRRLFFLVVLLIAAFVPALPTGAQTLLRVATPGALTGALPIYLGAKKGVFSKYGLTVEVIVTRNEQMNMQALITLTGSHCESIYAVDCSRIGKAPISSCSHRWSASRLFH
jgi:hypothetical protein